MRKCRTDLLCDQPIFVTQSVAQQILPSWWSLLRSDGLARIQRSLNLLDNSSLIKLFKDATSLGALCGIPSCLASPWITSKAPLFWGGTRIVTKFSTWIFGLSEMSWSTASLLILLHPSKLRYFKLRHEPAISLIVISVIWQKLRSSCWSLGQERITLQIDVSEYSLRLEIFRYSNLWHDFAILHRPLPSTSQVQKLLKPPGRSIHRDTSDSSMNLLSVLMLYY